MSFRARSLRAAHMFILFLCIGGLCWSTLALAAQPDPSLPGNHLVIKEVEVEVVGGDTMFTIKGEAFDFVNLSNLVVTLGEFGPLTIQGAPSNVEIVAMLPNEELISGDYLLSVFTGSGQSKHDEYDLTIGGAGPAGPAGADGQDGAVGSAGPAGANGQDGAVGPTGPAGPQGNDGPTGPMGFPGATGSQGPIGPEGPEGSVGTLVIKEKTLDVPIVEGQTELLRIKCEDDAGNDLGRVLSAGIEGLPTFSSIKTLTVDLVGNEAVIVYEIEDAEGQTGDVTGKAVCGSIQ